MMKTTILLFCFLFWFAFFQVMPKAICCLDPNYITDDRAIAAIVGEYAQNDEFGMRLLAHAIRNRGTLKGVYGLHAKHSLHEPRYIWIHASLAWFQSAKEIDLTNGATQWRSLDDITAKDWPKGLQLTFAYEPFYFFKTIKHRR